MRARSSRGATGTLASWGAGAARAAAYPTTSNVSTAWASAKWSVGPSSHLPSPGRDKSGPGERETTSGWATDRMRTCGSHSSWRASKGRK
uniref:Putative secreted protein n=1 Tax=Ixodes ricinus TaxID=34613 RepID=A0A6B0UAM5_IXORI